MVKLYLNYFPHSKMAISEHKNGHFEEIRGLLQILELGCNSTIFHLLFDTYDSSGAVFIWKWEKYRPYLLVCYVLFNPIYEWLLKREFWWPGERQEWKSLIKQPLLWQYRLWSFKSRDAKLERFLPKNQYTERKLLNLDLWEMFLLDNSSLPMIPKRDAVMLQDCKKEEPRLD